MEPARIAPEPSEFPVEYALEDGTRVRMRTLCPTDKAALRDGFEKLSPTSRYLRFLSPKGSLSERELDYLTNVDGDDHFAIGAAFLDDDGGEEPAGVARFVRTEHASDVAEPAIVVLDAMQGKGLGKLMLKRLTQEALAHGITHFRCLVRADNAAIRNLLDDIDPEPRILEHRNGLVFLDLSLLPPAKHTESPSEVLLAHAANERVVVQPPGSSPPPDNA